MPKIQLKNSILTNCMVYVLVKFSIYKYNTITFEKNNIMTQKFFTILLVTLIFSNSFSQEMPLDFEDNRDNFIVFGEINNNNPPNKFDIFNNPENSSDMVGRFFIDGKNSNPWQGFYIDLIKPINLDNNNKIITLDFYKYDGKPHTIIVKLEQGGSKPDVEVSFNIDNGPSTTQKWITNIQFDYTNAKKSTDGSPINANGSYNRVTIFIDGGVANKPPGTFLFNNINDGSTPTDPNQLDVVYKDLVWSDEFDSNGSVDGSKWHHQTFGPNGGGWFNGELQHYTNNQKNSFADGGNLHIVAKRETKVLNGVSRDFTSARLNSKYAFTYGRVDVRAKLPFGNGTWPAIWTLGKNISETGAYWQTQGYGTTGWPACGEIDIMEHGLHATNEVSSALHTPSSSGATVNTATKLLSDVTNNFHIYSMNWSPNQITFLIDNVVYYTYKPSVKNDATWPFNKEQFLLLNVAIGGFSGTPSSSFTESSMVIDYVRVYQNTSTAGLDENFSNKFSLFPNPANTSFRIKSTEKIEKIELFNNIGQKTFSKNYTPNQTIDVENLSKGMYFIKIFSRNKTILKKLIVN
ncbi:family 16 glycosylhydrolase [Polaribacter aquimarinus]|nr:family 16 glycosylhydrolase [Polaribacter aquimarinus]